MTNTEIAAALVKVKRKGREWQVFAPGQPGQKALRPELKTRKEAESVAFHVAAHIAAILDAADGLRGKAEFNAGVEAARMECGAMMRDARQMKNYVAGHVLSQLWSRMNNLRKVAQ